MANRDLARDVLHEIDQTLNHLKKVGARDLEMLRDRAEKAEKTAEKIVGQTVKKASETVRDIVKETAQEATKAAHKVLENLPAAKAKREQERAATTNRLLGVAIPALIMFGYQQFLRPRLLTAGTRPGEAERPLPGDELIPITSFQSTRGMDIDASPDAVWQWVMQIGRDSTGFYGLDALSNRGIPSASYLRKDLAAPKVGDALDGDLSILDVQTDAPRYVLYGAFDLPTFVGQPMERTTLIMIEERLEGGSRLLVRTRAYTFGMFGALANQYYEVMDYLHGMAQLNGLKLRAETAARLIVEDHSTSTTPILS